MTTNNNEMKISDIITILKAVEIANKKSAYNELEYQAIQPSFDAVHAFLVEQQNIQLANAKAAEEAAAQASVGMTNVAAPVEPATVVDNTAIDLTTAE